MKKNVEKKEVSPPEKFWPILVDVYFSFYKGHFKDNDGFPLTPDWSGPKRGMESKGLKEIITRLRTLAEQKDFDWTEQYSVEQLNIFFKKAYQKQFFKNSFLCCLLNKYKDEIIVSEYNDPLVKKILQQFYLLNPNYTKDEERDRGGAEIIIGFLKAQFIRSNIQFTEVAVLQSTKTIFSFVKQDTFWNTKSLKSISNNLQEFVNKIKAAKNGNNGFGNIGKRPDPGIKDSGDFGQL